MTDSMKIWFAGPLLSVLLSIFLFSCGNGREVINTLQKIANNISEEPNSNYRIDIKPTDDKNIQYSVSVQDLLYSQEILIPTSINLSFNLQFSTSFNYLLKITIPDSIYENTNKGITNSILTLSAPRTDVVFEIYPQSATLPPVRLEENLNDLYSENSTITVKFPYPEYFTATLHGDNLDFLKNYSVFLESENNFISGKTIITSDNFSIPYLNDIWQKYDYVIFRDDNNPFNPFFKIKFNKDNHDFYFDGEVNKNKYTIATNKSIDGDFTYYLAIKGETSLKLSDNNTDTFGKIEGDYETKEDNISIDLYRVLMICISFLKH